MQVGCWEVEAGKILRGCVSNIREEKGLGRRWRSFRCSAGNGWEGLTGCPDPLGHYCKGAKPGQWEQKDWDRDEWESCQEDLDLQEMQTECQGERKGEDG